jgi:hypothetical protein
VSYVVIVIKRSITVSVIIAIMMAVVGWVSGGQNCVLRHCDEGRPRLLRCSKLSWSPALTLTELAEPVQATHLVIKPSFFTCCDLFAGALRCSTQPAPYKILTIQN